MNNKEVKEKKILLLQKGRPRFTKNINTKEIIDMKDSVNCIKNNRKKGYLSNAKMK